MKLTLKFLTNLFILLDTIIYNIFYQYFIFDITKGCELAVRRIRQPRLYSKSYLRSSGGLSRIKFNKLLVLSRRFNSTWIDDESSKLDVSIKKFKLSSYVNSIFYNNAVYKDYLDRIDSLDLVKWSEVDFDFMFKYIGDDVKNNIIDCKLLDKLVSYTCDWVNGKIKNSEYLIFMAGFKYDIVKDSQLKYIIYYEVESIWYSYLYEMSRILYKKLNRDDLKLMIPFHIDPNIISVTNIYNTITITFRNREDFSITKEFIGDYKPVEGRYRIYCFDPVKGRFTPSLTDDYKSMRIYTLDSLNRLLSSSLDIFCDAFYQLDHTVFDSSSDTLCKIQFQSDLSNEDLIKVINFDWLNIGSPTVDNVYDRTSVYHPVDNKPISSNSTIRDLLRENVDFMVEQDSIYNSYIKTDRVITEDYINRLNKSLSRDYVIGALDIETFTEFNGTLSPFVLCYSDSEGNSKSFYGVDCVVDYLDYIRNLKLSLPLRIYVHNGSKFDFIFLLHNVLSIRASISDVLKINNRKSNIISMNYVGRSIMFIDSYRILSASLSDMAKSFNLDFNKDDRFDYIFDVECELMAKGKYNSISVDQRERMIDYCMADTNCLLSVMQIFNSKLLELGGGLILGNTISMLSFHDYVINHGWDILNNSNDIYTIPKQFDEVVTGSYNGGICDVFKRLLLDNSLFNSLSDILPNECFTDNNILYEDLVSSYPNSMSNNKLGVGLPIPTSKLIYDNDNKLLPGFYHLNITTLDNRGLLYCKGIIEGNGYSSFIGKNIDVFLPSFEIEYLESIGFIKVNFIHSGVYYNKTANLFFDYVNKWFNIKRTSSKSDPIRSISKLFLNSLYGIFGLKTDQHYIVYISPAIRTDIYELLCNNEVIVKPGIINILSESEYRIVREIIKTNPGLDSYIDILTKPRFRQLHLNRGISSWITSLSRITLIRKWLLVGLDNLIYSDTDSVIYLSEAESKTINTGELGSWEDASCKVNEEVRIVGVTCLLPKTYSIIYLGLESGKIYEVSKNKGLPVKGVVEYSSVNSFISEFRNYYNNISISDYGFISGSIRLINSDVRIRGIFNNLKRDMRKLVIRNRELLDNIKFIKKVDNKRLFTSINSSVPRNADGQ